MVKPVCWIQGCEPARKLLAVRIHTRSMRFGQADDYIIFISDITYLYVQ